jgi:hypothetical protein
MRQRFAVGILASALFVCRSFAQEPAQRVLELRSPVQDKNFYVLSLLDRTPEATKAVREEGSLASILERKRMALESAARSCETVSCVDEALRWTDSEIAAGADGLRKVYSTNDAARKMVEGTLRESGAYIRYESKAGGDLLAQAWTDAARGMNRAIDVYAEGKNPRYPAIDSPAFDVKGAQYERMVHTVAYVVVEQAPQMRLFFQPTLKFALYLLDINKRDEAGRLEPLEEKENAAAVSRIRTIEWSRFPYTVIMVPGQGGDRVTWALAPEGRLRIEIAAGRWREGKAPLILVSGGYVHPNQTPFSEAVEMKKTLIADFGVPEDAILIDPHARHTTTNLRNSAREMYRYGVPFDHSALITTDSYDSAYIESAEFAKRCQDELGYMPYGIVKRLSVFDLEWVPKVESLQIDAAGDLLDP